MDQLLEEIVLQYNEGNLDDEGYKFIIVTTETLLTYTDDALFKLNNLVPFIDMLAEYEVLCEHPYVSELANRVRRISIQFKDAPVLLYSNRIYVGGHVYYYDTYQEADGKYKNTLRKETDVRTPLCLKARRSIAEVESGKRILNTFVFD